MAYHNIFNIWFHRRDEESFELNKRGEEKGLLDCIERDSCLILIALLIGGIILNPLNLSTIMGIFMGGVTSILNFKGLRWILKRIIKGKKIALYGILLGLKFLLLTLIIFFNIIYMKVNYLAFVIGLSVILMAIGVESVIFYLKEGNI